MAGSDSPAFNPPSGTVKDTDPMVVKVPMDHTDFGFRKSQVPSMESDHLQVVHVKSGG